MNHSSLCSLMFFTLCLILISHSPLPTKASRPHGHLNGLQGQSKHDLIEQVCNQSLDSKDNCTKILRSHPKIVQAKNFFDISKEILKLAIKEGTEGQDFIKGVAQKKNTTAIALCAYTYYDQMVLSFTGALAELKEDPFTANYDAKVAGDGPVYCESAMGSEHLVNPQISEINHNMSFLSLIAFYATNFLSDD